MNKDALFATIIGFIIGLIITSIVLFSPGVVSSIKQAKLPNFSQFNLSFLQKDKSSSDQTYNEPQKDQIPTDLSLDAPADSFVSESETILFSGSAIPGSLIVISSQNDDLTVTAQENGSFAQELSLVEGKNEILTVMIADNLEKSINTIVYYNKQ